MMKNQIQKTICALAVMAATSLPAMAESVDVHVIGTITPAACTPTISGGATVDYGNINPTNIKADTYTVLDEKQLDFTIQCDAPAKVAVRAINGRPGSLAGATEGATGAATQPAGVLLFGNNNVASVGLGLDGTSKVGGYGIRLAARTAMADGVAVDNIFKNNITDAVYTSMAAAGATGALYNSTTPRILTWGAAGTVLPIAFETLTAKLGVQAYINKGSELDLTKPVALDGLTTLELVYL